MKNHEHLKTMVGEGLPYSEKDIGKEDMEKGRAGVEVTNIQTKLMSCGGELSILLKTIQKLHLKPNTSQMSR